MPDQLTGFRCQATLERWAPHAAAFSVTYRGAPVKAPGATLPGMTWTEAVCRSHVDARTAQVRSDGGEILDCLELEVAAPPTPIEPAPVGLDAIDPPVQAQAEPFRPNWAVHPGEVLAELLEEQHLTKTLAAAALGWHGDWVGQVIDGRRDITLEMAGSLGSVFGPPIGFWLRLQARYDEWRAEQGAGVG